MVEGGEINVDILVSRALSKNTTVPKVTVAIEALTRNKTKQLRHSSNVDPYSNKNLTIALIIYLWVWFKITYTLLFFRVKSFSAKNDL